MIGVPESGGVISGGVSIGGVGVGVSGIGVGVPVVNTMLEVYTSDVVSPSAAFTPVVATTAVGS